MVDNWVGSQLVRPGFFLAARACEELHDGETQGYSREFLSDMGFGTFLCCVDSFRGSREAEVRYRGVRSLFGYSAVLHAPKFHFSCKKHTTSYLWGDFQVLGALNKNYMGHFRSTTGIFRIPKNTTPIRTIPVTQKSKI